MYLFFRSILFRSEYCPLIVSDIKFLYNQEPESCPFLTVPLKDRFVGSQHGGPFHPRVGRSSQDSPWGPPMPAKLAPRARTHTPIVPPPNRAVAFGAHPLGPTHHTSPPSLSHPSGPPAGRFTHTTPRLFRSNSSHAARGRVTAEKGSCNHRGTIPPPPPSDKQ